MMTASTESVRTLLNMNVLPTPPAVSARPRNTRWEKTRAKIPLGVPLNRADLRER